MHPFANGIVDVYACHSIGKGGLEANFQTEPLSAAKYWFTHLEGKLAAFTRVNDWTLRQIKSEPHADVRLLRETVAHRRNLRTKQAIVAISKAIARQPYDPILHEIVGQVLRAPRNFAASVNAYVSAVEPAPNGPLIPSGYGHALLTIDQVKQTNGVLEKSRPQD